MQTCQSGFVDYLISSIRYAAIPVVLLLRTWKSETPVLQKSVHLVQLIFKSEMPKLLLISGEWNVDWRGAVRFTSAYLAGTYSCRKILSCGVHLSQKEGARVWASASLHTTVVLASSFVCPHPPRRCTSGIL